MKGGAFGFSRRELIWFAVIVMASLLIAVFCLFRIGHKLYRSSDESAVRIRQLSSEILHLQEVNMQAVTIQRSSLNLIIYANNKKELESIEALIKKNRDTMLVTLAGFQTRATLQPPLAQALAAAGSDYLEANEQYRQMINDSIHSKLAPDFNVQKMRPSLRKFTDLIRKTSLSLTTDIHETSTNRLNIFSMYESWILLAVLTPYFYFFYRFIRLFIKVLVMDTEA